jgi:hypothetical protein
MTNEIKKPAEKVLIQKSFNNFSRLLPSANSTANLGGASNQQTQSVASSNAPAASSSVPANDQSNNSK